MFRSRHFLTPSATCETSKYLVSEGIVATMLEFEEIVRRAKPGVKPAAREKEGERERKRKREEREERREKRETG